MNKIIFGGILVTMIGGTPTATYFLTKGSSEEKEKPVRSDQRTTSGGTDNSSISCSPQGNGQTCPSA